MPVSKSRRKGKARSKGKNFSTNGTTIETASGSAGAQTITRGASTPIDDPWFTFVIFLSLVSGSIAAGGMVPPDFLNFSMILGTLMAGRYLGALVALNKSPLSIRSVSASIEDLKKDSRKGHGQLGKLGQGELIEVCLISILLAGLLSLFLGVTEELQVTTLLLGSAAFLVYLRARIPSDPLSLVVSALVVLLLPCLLTVLGIFCQSGQLRSEGIVLGLVPGSMLAAAVVAKHAKLLEERGWKRSKLVPQKKGGEALRPGSVAQLYTGFLLGGFFVVFVMSSMGSLPRPLMVVVLTMFIAPKVATSFLERTTTDERTFHSTIRLAAISGVLTLVGGALSGL